MDVEDEAEDVLAENGVSLTECVLFCLTLLVNGLHPGISVVRML